MAFGQTEFKVSVAADQAGTARDLINSHVDEAAAAEVRRLSETLGPLEAQIDYEFRDLGLLEHALTHRSRAHEDASGGVMDNESMEFLGDAVLGFVMADMLFHRFPKHSEGYKSKVKAGIVSAASLTRLAEEIELGRFVLLGRGEEKTGGRHKHAILADSLEALIAAIYLDGGIEAGAGVHRRAVRSARLRPREIGRPRRASRRTGNRRSRNGCRPPGGACRSTAWLPRKAPTIANASRSKSWSAASPRAGRSGDPRRRPNSRRPARPLRVCATAPRPRRPCRGPERSIDLDDAGAPAAFVGVGRGGDRLAGRVRLWQA